MNDIYQLNQLKEHFQYLARRASTLCGVIQVKEEDGRLVPKPLGETVSRFFTQLAGDLADPKTLQARAEFLARAERDPEARQHLNALRLETFSNFLMADMRWIDFYAEIVTLGEKERPVEQNTTGMEVQCTYISEDGSPNMVRVRKDDIETLIPLRYLTTPRVRMKEFDLYRGTVVDAALQTLKLAFDLRQKMELEFKAMLDASAFGTFTFTGKKANYPFVPHSAIKTANLPTTNDIVVTGANNSTKFGFATLDEIIDYAARWNGLSPEGNLVPTGRVLVASSQVRQFGSDITPSGATSNAIADSLLEKGWTGVVYRGINWVFIPDPTIDPNQYTVYPEFNQKPARVYFKPSADQEVVRTGRESPELFDANEQERQMRKAFGASINSANRRKIARFRFNTTGL